MTRPSLTLRYGVSMKPNSLIRAKVDIELIRPMFGPSGRFDRADAAVVRRMNVAHFEARALAERPPGPRAERRRLCVSSASGLVWSMNCESWLRPKKSRMTARQRLRVDQLLRRHRVGVHVEQRHALLDQALGAGQADAALVGEKFAHGAHAAAAEMIDVVERAFALAQADEVLGRGDEVFVRHDALVQIGTSMPSFWLIL